jgi:hypothetical protein
MFIHGVVQRPDDGLLSGIVHGPERNVVVELGVEQVSCEIKHDSVKLEVLPGIDWLRLSIVVHKRLTWWELV